LAGTNILVVEDEAFIRMVTSEFLRDEGFSVIEAENATAALAMLEGDQEVDLLFTDIDLNDRIDGLELMHLVANRWPNVRLFAASGAVILTPSAMPQRAKFFAKPYAMSTIAEAFRH